MTTNLIVAAGSEERSVLVHFDHANPVAMADEGADAIAGRDFPHLDLLVTGGGHQMVAGGDESDGRHVVVVAVERSQTLVRRRRKVPQLDRHVSRTRC